MDTKDFIKVNRNFWKYLTFPVKKKSIKSLLLVEVDGDLSAVHENASMSKILSEAINSKIEWVIFDKNNYNAELLKSYDSESVFCFLENLKKSDKILYYLYLIKFKLILFFNKDNLLNLKIGGIIVGDIIYDTYLARKKTATITTIDKYVLELLRITLYYYFSIRRTFINKIPDSILLCDTYMIRGALLFRIALKRNITVYCRPSRAGIVKFNGKEKIYLDRKVKPLKENFEFLKSLSQSFIDKEFKQLASDTLQGLNDDIAFAYSSDRKYTSKSIFCEDFGLDKNKKNVFVMLCQFYDYPNTYYKFTMFKDYYEWFVDTLKVAKENKTVNWIFKEHPISKYFPTSDQMNMHNYFDKNDKHILFLDYNYDLNSGSLVNIADVIVTTVGSAGYEFAAIAGIPPIVTSDNAYTGFGFTFEPKNKKEYLHILLNNVQLMEKLNEEQIYHAKLVYLFIKKYRKVEGVLFPDISFEFSIEFNESKYWDLVSNLYNTKKNEIESQVNNIISQIREKDFSRILGYPFRNLNIGDN